MLHLYFINSIYKSEKVRRSVRRRNCFSGKILCYCSHYFCFIPSLASMHLNCVVVLKPNYLHQRRTKCMLLQRMLCALHSPCKLGNFGCAFCVFTALKIIIIVGHLCCLSVSVAWIVHGIQYTYTVHFLLFGLGPIRVHLFGFTFCWAIFWKSSKARRMYSRVAWLCVPLYVCVYVYATKEEKKHFTYFYCIWLFSLGFYFWVNALFVHFVLLSFVFPRKHTE